jgi:hypothetical protein
MDGPCHCTILRRMQCPVGLIGWRSTRARAYIFSFWKHDGVVGEGGNISLLFDATLCICSADNSAGKERKKQTILQGKKERKKRALVHLLTTSSGMRLCTVPKRWQACREKLFVLSRLDYSHPELYQYHPAGTYVYIYKYMSCPSYYY